MRGEYFMWTKEDEQRVINETFGGDAEKYFADIREGHRKAIQWDNLVSSAFILPELETDALELIKQLLGYLPDALLTIPQEPFIRSLLHNYRNGGMTIDDLFSQAEEHIKQIRNEELINNACLTYPRALYGQYFSSLPEVAAKVKTRLTRFLGYEPALEHSLVAELNFQDCLLDDTMHFTEMLSRADIQSITIIKYREVLMAKGKTAADASPLVAMEIIAEHCVKKQNDYR